MTVGERIAQLRKQLNMTQPMLAEEMNVSQSTVASWENDRRKISNEDLVHLARLFRVTTDYILGISATSIDDETIDMADTYSRSEFLRYQGKQLSDDDWDIIDAILQRRKSEKDKNN